MAADEVAWGRDFWIPFAAAERAVSIVLAIADDEPDERPPCVVLSGPSGVGKTAVLRQAERRIAKLLRRPSGLARDAAFHPFVRVTLPSNPTSVKLNTALLWKLGWPISAGLLRIADLRAVDALRDVRARVVAFDEIHNLLEGGRKSQADVLDALRFLMSESNLPIVVAGTERARDVFAADDELASRAVLVELAPFPPGEDFQRLLRAVEKALALPEPSDLDEPGSAALLHELTRGLTGNVVKLLHWAGRLARDKGALAITRTEIETAYRMLPPYRFA